jgi:hypothetical protein
MNNYLIKKIAKISLFSSLNKKLKLKLHMFETLWDTMGCPKRHKDLSEMVREYLGDIGGYLGHHRRGQGHHGEQGERLGHGEEF